MDFPANIAKNLVGVLQGQPIPSASIVGRCHLQLISCVVLEQVFHTKGIFFPLRFPLILAENSTETRFELLQVSLPSSVKNKKEEKL